MSVDEVQMYLTEKHACHLVETNIMSMIIGRIVFKALYYWTSSLFPAVVAVDLEMKDDEDNGGINPITKI